MKKGEIIENLEITSISSEGKGVGRIDGQVVFVKDTVPGDVITAKSLGKKKKVLQAMPVEFKTYSKDRTEPFCEHFGLCGGCKWQHMGYESQLKFKEEHVSENLRKLSGLELPEISPILGSEKTTFYRNKLEYTFSNFRWLTREEIDSEEEHLRTALGFHIPGRFDKILDVKKCFLQEDPSNEIRLAVKEFADQNNVSFFDLKNQHGFLRNLIVRTSTTGDLMVILQVFHKEGKNLELVLNFLKDKFPAITSLMYIINEKRNDSFTDQEVHLFHGDPFITEQMGELKFRIGPKSFYQTNSNQAHELYKIAADFANIQKDELVYDLYTGTGTIANFVAGSARKVVGIEYVEDAIADAKVNSELNGITNTSFFAGDMKDMLANEFINEHGKPDVIITDPPRAGMHARVTQMLTDLKADRIVYVSCNSATQARDLQILGTSYDVVKIQPVDMFPHTQHVENVVLLELR